MKKNILLTAAALVTTLAGVAQWQPAGDRIRTQWGEKLDPQNVLPEYPRPQMVRGDWQNLNGKPALIRTFDQTLTRIGDTGHTCIRAIANALPCFHAVERAIDANSPDPADPIDVLSKVGGFDIAAMCGFYLGAAASKAPALLDGVISCTAALCAARLCPNALGYLVGTHASSEPASQELLRELGIKAPLDAGMHLGEGAGAMAYLPLLDSALRVYRDGKTFTATGMAAYEHFEAGK